MSLIPLVTTCGVKRDKVNEAPPAVSHTERLFLEASAKYEIPVRFLMAVAYMESGISENRSSVKYQNSDNKLGISVGDTAFGLSYRTLFPGGEAEPEDLALQIDAYGALVHGTLSAQESKPTANPTTLKDKFDWIHQIAKIHRGGLRNNKNVQKIFSMELMNLLDEGFNWQDPKTGEIVIFAKESPPFNAKESTDPILKENLGLLTGESTVYSAQYIELPFLGTPTREKNSPEYIRVIHCPFTLSACLEIQSTTEEHDGVRINAHYIIPQNDLEVTKPLQVRRHEQTVKVTEKGGTPTEISDAIVLMLVGESGRYIESVRTQANPTWLTKWQLAQMGTIIRNLCQQVPTMHPTNCEQPGTYKGVVFSNQVGMNYRWGDIPDYSPDIFWPYISSQDAHEGNMTVTFNSATNIFPANQAVQMNVQFFNEASNFLVEQAARCSNKKLVWKSLANMRVQNQNSTTFSRVLFDMGPNNNGEHYLRTMITDIQGKLLGWEVNKVILTGYSKHVVKAPIGLCQGPTPDLP